eukprot:1929672-Alexandrium_andersonii.AAC.1
MVLSCLFSTSRNTRGSARGWARTPAAPARSPTHRWCWGSARARAVPRPLQRSGCSAPCP